MPTIPKIIFQTSKYEQYDYAINLIKQKAPNWDYKQFTDADILQFFIENPHNDYPNITEKFHSMQCGAHKADLFRYYYLYLKGGVFIDSDAMLEDNIENITQNYEFFSVDSSYHAFSIFQGFIGCIPGHPIIQLALKNVCDIDVNILNQSYHILCSNLYAIVKGVQKANICDNNLIMLYKECRGDENRAVMTNDTNIILSHYFVQKIIPFPNKLADRRKIIGITFNFPSNQNDLYSNGLNQNAIYLYDLLTNIGYETYLIIEDRFYKNISSIDYFKNNKYNFVEYKNMVIFPFDVVILLSFIVSNDILLKLKNKNVKNILYSCGNDHFINCEHILYNRPGNLITTCINKQPTLDQVWIIPQMVNTTLQYHTTFQRCKCIEVPFIWSHKCIDEVSKTIKKDFHYVKRPGLKQIGIFEPNMSIMKWAMPAILVCENAYRFVPDKIKQVYVTNVVGAIEQNKFHKEPFEKLISTFDLRIDNKLTIESRYNTLEFMCNNCDIAVSYQMENNLNYLYLDLAWMGWPIVHNANLCKDIGYYYEEFDYEMGGKVLVNTIMFHDDNAIAYMEKNRKLIDRYLPTNKILQSKYKKIVDDLFV